MSCSFVFYAELTTVPLFGRRFLSVLTCLGPHAMKLHLFECTVCVCVCECLLFLKFCNFFMNAKRQEVSNPSRETNIGEHCGLFEI